MGSRQVKSRATREMTDQALPIGATAIKPVERHGWEAFSWFMYDKNTGAIMGRTPMSWFLITVFYIIYYSCLAGFWALCLFIFYQSPLVAVKINDINPGQLIHVECRAWAKNIKYNRRDRVGIVRFEVMNHNSKTT